jgi:large conductance mechanosensitive channel
LKEISGDVAATVISYSKFIQTVIDSTIIAFVIFIVIKAINSQKENKKKSCRHRNPKRRITAF